MGCEIDGAGYLTDPFAGVGKLVVAVPAAQTTESENLRHKLKSRLAESHLSEAERCYPKAGSVPPLIFPTPDRLEVRVRRFDGSWVNGMNLWIGRRCV